MKESQCDLPTFYLYRGDDGKMHKTDAELTGRLNRISIIKSGKLIITREYFPQWPEPKYKSQTRPAWKITKDGIRVIRCYLRRCQHTRDHGNGTCRMIGEHECARTCAIYLQWDAKSSLWVQAPTINKLED